MRVLSRPLSASTTKGTRLILRRALSTSSLDIQSLLVTCQVKCESGDAAKWGSVSAWGMSDEGWAPRECAW